MVNVGTRQDPLYIPVELCSVKADQAADANLQRVATRKLQAKIPSATLRDSRGLTTSVIQGLQINAGPTLVSVCQIRDMSLHHSTDSYSTEKLWDPAFLGTEHHI